MYSAFNLRKKFYVTWSVPYFQGGSCNGLSLASGVLAGKTAAEDVL